MSDLDTVQETFFRRMLLHAYEGFVKSAVLAAVIGGVVAVGLVSLHLLPALAVGGLLHAFTVGALICFLPGGTMGSAAAINSVRDARQFMLHRETVHNGTHAEHETGVVEEAAKVSGAQIPSTQQTNWLEKVKTSSMHAAQAQETGAIRK